MRYAVVITGYKKRGNSIENFIIQSIQHADSREDAIYLACKSESVVDLLINDNKIYWKKAIEISDLDLLKAAFEAGQDYENECHCGKCDYCLDIKTEDATDFETWVKKQ